MKLANFFVCAATLSPVVSWAQVPDVSGSIRSTASLPGTIGFVITGDVAETMFDTLSVPAMPDHSFGPGVAVLKAGVGVNCRFFATTKVHACEIAMTESGVFVP